MPTPAQESDAILAAAGRSLANQRAGGRRVVGPPIGRRSAALRRKRQLRQMALAGGGVLGAILVFTLVANALSLTLHIAGWSIAFLPILFVFGLVWHWRTRSMPNIPSLPQLAKTPARKLVANTQLWLEAQRRDLPAAAVPILRTIGGQLDALAAQLDKIDEAAPAVAQVRALVGEHLPAVVSAYIAVPVPLRGQSHAGASPDAQLVTALQQISREITSVTRQLAEGALDRLAIETRFLEAKWGESAPGPD